MLLRDKSLRNLSRIVSEENDPAFGFQPNPDGVWSDDWDSN
jgi:hypothetical protein